METKLIMASELKKYSGLDGIRALACIGIVLSHVHLNVNYNISDFWFASIIPSFGCFVFLFFTISGFGMCCGYYERILKGQIDLTEFYKKRFQKIWPFFAAVCILDFIGSPSKGALVELFSDLTLFFGFIPNADIHIIGVGWFLGVLFAFYFMFPFIVFLLASKKRAWFSFVVALVLNLCCKYYYNVDKRAIAFSFVFFLSGGIVYLYKEQIENIRFGGIILPILIIASSIAYYFISSDSITVICFCVFVLMYGMIVPERHFFNSKPLRLLGGISFEMYLCHMMFYRIVERCHFLSLTENDNVNFVIVSLAVLIGTIVFSFIAKKVVEIMERYIIRLFEGLPKFLRV